MKLIVNPHKIELIQEEAVNEKEIDISKCEFEFDEEITNDYVKEAYFTLGDNTYKQVIVNDQCSIPQEVLIKPATIELGVVAYLVEDETEIKRYNPTPVYFKTDLGSLKQAQNSQPITPSEMEQYEQALQGGLTELDDALDDLQEKVDSGYFDGQDGRDGTDGITPTIGNNGNWYLGDTDTGKPSRGATGETGQTGATGQDGFSPTVSTSKSDGVTTIEITDKNGTHTATINDGVNGANGTNGRDGYVQYTAGTNITIDANNVISAEGGKSSLYTLIIPFAFNDNAGTQQTTDATALASASKIINDMNASTEKGGIIYVISSSNGISYTFHSKTKISTSSVGFYFYADASPFDMDSTTRIHLKKYLTIYGSWSNGVYTASQITYDAGAYYNLYNFLAKNNTASYNVTNNYNPAHKKYVDDNTISKKTTMPTASSSTVGTIVQYQGTTDANYTNGYFYIGTTDGGNPATYSWEQLNVQPSGSSGDTGDLVVLNVDISSFVNMYSVIEGNDLNQSINVDSTLSALIDRMATIGFNKVRLNIKIDDYNSFITTGYRYAVNPGQYAYHNYDFIIYSQSYAQTKYVSLQFQIYEYGDYKFMSIRTFLSRGMALNDNVLLKNNTTAYTPTADYHPATKKYIDDKIWVGTQAEYDLLTPSNDTLYFIKES